jgi:membrane protein DedA with SNARE-associated domain
VLAFLGISLSHLIDTYGYAALFLLVGLESVGVPLPGETALITASLYAGTTHRLNITIVIAVAALAAILGDNVGFLLGRWGGYRLLRRYGHFVRVNEHRVKIGRYLFDRHGGKVVFSGRFVSVLRTYAAFLAGTMRMRWWRFLVFNAAGGVVWAVLVGVGFYYFGSTLETLQARLDIGIAAAAVLAFVAGFVLLRRKEKELGVAAERAYPGALE